MGRLGAIGILGVLDGADGTDILRDFATEGDGEGLDATADAEDGQLTVVGQTGDEQLGQVALFVDAMEQGRGLFTSPEGVDVATAAEDETVDAVEGVDDDVGRVNRGYHEGYTTGGYHRLIVALAEFTGEVFVVARDADDGLPVGFGEAGIDVIEVGF